SASPGAPRTRARLHPHTTAGTRRGGRGVDIPKKAADPVDRPKDKAPEPPAPKKDDPPKTLQIGKLIGPAQKPHPWAKMLGDKKPEVGPLANCVPEDFWFAEFRSLAAVNQVTGLSELWGGHLFTQALGEARSQLTVERIKKQL